MTFYTPKNVTWLKYIVTLRYYKLLFYATRKLRLNSLWPEMFQILTCHIFLLCNHFLTLHIWIKDAVLNTVLNIVFIRVLSTKLSTVHSLQYPLQY